MYSTSIENLNTTINDESYDLMSIEPPPIEFSDDATDSNNSSIIQLNIQSTNLLKT